MIKLFVSWSGLNCQNTVHRSLNHSPLGIVWGQLLTRYEPFGTVNTVFTCLFREVFWYPCWNVWGNLQCGFGQTHVSSFGWVYTWLWHCSCLWLDCKLLGEAMDICKLGAYRAVTVYDFLSCNMLMTTAEYHRLLGGVLKLTCWPAVTRFSFVFS